MHGIGVCGGKATAQLARPDKICQATQAEVVGEGEEVGQRYDDCDCGENNFEAARALDVGDTEKGAGHIQYWGQ